MEGRGHGRVGEGGGTRGGMEGGRADRGWREGARGWWGGRLQGEGGREGGREQGEGVEAMMLGRQRAPVEEGRVEGGRVDEGNERGRDGTMHGRRYGGSERRRD